MTKLVSVLELANELDLCRQTVYQKINDKTIPLECLVILPGKKAQLRINIDKLFTLYPNLKRPRVSKEECITIQLLANLLRTSYSDIYRKVQDGTYPHIKIKSCGPRNKLRVPIKKLLLKFPELRDYIRS